MSYSDNIKQIASLRAGQNGNWNAISPEYAARMRVQNRFQSGLDIARYTAAIMRKDMAEYDADS
jgi:isocitrate lyase